MLLYILGIVVVIWWFVNDRRKCAGYPPGPIRFPLVGNLPQIVMQTTSMQINEGLAKLADRYGGVMHLRMGMMDTIFISTYECATEFFAMNANNNRHLLDFMRDRNDNGNFGLVLSQEEVWQTLRRFTIRTLRDFGFGRSASMDQIINEEVSKFVVHFKSQLETSNNGIYHMKNTFDLTIENVIWRLVTGRQYDMNDARIKKLLQLSDDFATSSNLAGLSLTYPGIRRMFPEWSARNLQLKCIGKLKDFFREVIQEHRSRGTYLEKPKCFVDAFLAKIDEAVETQKESDSFNDMQLLHILLDLFQAGSETTSKSISWGILYMTVFPEIQKKVQEEIDYVIGGNEPVTLDIKSKMPFTAATILEIIRYSSVAPLTSTRVSHEDIYLNGYKIPKGISIMINLEAVNHQKSIWGDPAAFRPQRFLKKSMEIDTKLTDHIVGFGGGKRICLGKQLAESTLFIYFTSLMKKYKFAVPKGGPTPSLMPHLGFTQGPVPFDVHIRYRTPGN